MIVVWSEPAEEALDFILDFIARDNYHASAELGELLIAAAGKLAVLPYLGKAGREQNSRELIVHRHYIVVYNVVEDTVNILSVLHTSRQWPPLQ